MVDPDAIARRLLSLNEALGHLQAHAAGLSADRLTAEPVLQAAVERWLQIAVESCVDCAYHLVADGGWTPPDSARHAFETLASHGIISVALAKQLGRAAGLRNILVHDYTRVDREILAATVRTGLDDLRAFASAVRQWVWRDEGS